MEQENKKIYHTQIYINLDINTCDKYRNVFDCVENKEYVYIHMIGELIRTDSLNSCIFYSDETSVSFDYYSYNPDVNAAKIAIEKEMNIFIEKLSEAKQLIKSIS